MSVVDTSSNVSHGIATLKGHGVTAVGRYYSSSRWKRITKSEAEKVCAAGMKLFTVFEDSGDPLLTEENGKRDGQKALEQAKEIGQPEGSAIYIALEHLPHGYDKSHIPDIKKYMRGVKSVLDGYFKVGVYSDGVVLQALLDKDLIDHAWLSASSSFPGSKEFYQSGRWALAQRKVDLDWDGLSIDTNEAKDDFGAFVVRPGNTATSFLSSVLESGAGTGGGDAGKIDRLVELGGDPAGVQKVEAMAKKTMAQIGYVFPRKSCAAMLSHFLRTAGIDVPITTGAQTLADRLRLSRKWKRISNGQQEAGDVGVCRSVMNDVSGADHIYLVVETINADLMVIADNQGKGQPHQRRVSGKAVPGFGSKTATEYFLRAPQVSATMMTLGEAPDGIDGADIPDDDTDDLPELFMDDGTPRSVEAEALVGADN